MNAAGISGTSTSDYDDNYHDHDDGEEDPQSPVPAALQSAGAHSSRYPGATLLACTR